MEPFVLLAFFPQLYSISGVKIGDFPLKNVVFVECTKGRFGAGKDKWWFWALRPKTAEMPTEQGKTQQDGIGLKLDTENTIKREKNAKRTNGSIFHAPTWYLSGNRFQAQRRPRIDTYPRCIQTGFRYVSKTPLIIQAIVEKPWARAPNAPLRLTRVHEGIFCGPPPCAGLPLMTIPDTLPLKNDYMHIYCLKNNYLIYVMVTCLLDCISCFQLVSN